MALDEEYQRTLHGDLEPAMVKVEMDDDDDLKMIIAAAFDERKKKKKDIFVTKECRCKAKRKVVKSKVSPRKVIHSG